VKYAFYAGGVVLLGAMLWTVLSTREYPPEQLESFSDNRVEDAPTVIAGAWKVGALFLVIRDPHWLIASMVGVGFAWASILSLPYAMLSDNLPAAKMGIFNFFIVIPQLMAASVLGVLLKLFFHDQPVYALGLGGASLLLAGLCTLRVRVPAPGVPAPASP